MRQGGKHAGTITGVGFAPATATMIHVLQHDRRVLDNLVRALTPDIGNKANTATVVFVGGIVESLRFGYAVMHIDFLFWSVAPAVYSETANAELY